MDQERGYDGMWLPGLEEGTRLIRRGRLLSWARPWTSSPSPTPRLTAADTGPTLRDRSPSTPLHVSIANSADYRMFRSRAVLALHLPGLGVDARYSLRGRTLSMALATRVMIGLGFIVLFAIFMIGSQSFID